MRKGCVHAVHADCLHATVQDHNVGHAQCGTLNANSVLAFARIRNTIKLTAVSPVSNANEMCCSEQVCKRLGGQNVIKRLVLKEKKMNLLLFWDIRFGRIDSDCDSFADSQKSRLSWFYPQFA
ncbi:hypothetical protein IscW_ISCW007898 [Ixodes scapularis]|uniref:Uncharacterized protein n=1 Tax=Ixodes scapularis TaxID=6945 RepID=B7PTS9_IXOSC|nr:hypothetical protein IscW_ISCW007898 [Ixodes scapularis]|eukprot:XP_002404849.1 hypothetical protein IscW_ISCW007898 [Ixodes scapularis]